MKTAFRQYASKSRVVYFTFPKLLVLEEARHHNSQAMQQAPTRPKLHLRILAAGVLISVALWFSVFRKHGRSQNQTSSVQTNAQQAATVSTAPSPLNTTATNSSQQIAAAIESLKTNSNRVGAAKDLEELRKRLNALGAQAASLTVQQWLDSGEDALTHLGFKLAADGSLKEAPTLRTFLLDYLIQIDPEAAVTYAKKILSSQNSPDEWAVALRAYARVQATPEAQAFLQQKIREMLGNQDWRNHPSVGFLEAFDVIVYSRDQELTPGLAGFVRQPDNRALAHAAYLTLDRLVQAAPTDVLGQLQTQPELMEGHEATRADFFARADVRDSQQKTILENYLLDPHRSAVELQQFAGIYPNANYAVSYNLLTRTASPSGAELAARDRESLKVVQQWLGDPRFAKLAPQLQTIKSRLEQFVKLPSQSQP